MHMLLEDPVFSNLLATYEESLLETFTRTNTPDTKADGSPTSSSDTDETPGFTEDMQNQMTYPGTNITYNVAPQHPQVQHHQQMQHQQQQQQQQQQGHHVHYPQQHQMTQFPQQFEMIHNAANPAGFFLSEHHTEPPMLPQNFTQQFPTNMRYPGSMALNRSSGDSASSYQPSIFSENMSMSTETLDGMGYHQHQPHMDDMFIKEQIKSEIGESLQHPETIAQKKFHKFYTTAGPHMVPAMPSTAPNKDFPKVKKKTSNYHNCPFCQRSFKNKSYLSRHLKKHDTVKDFKCPFFNPKHSKCHHLNGEFSRKDTFKAHLKSIHFIYPIGVAKSDRNDSPGRCAGCFKEFSNNTEWLNTHIKNDECTGFAKFKDDE